MSFFLPPVVRWQGRALMRRFDHAVQHPEHMQRSLLRSLLHRHGTTVFGQQHGFNSIHTPEDYRRAVPIQDYEGFRPYVNRILQGEQHILVNDPVRFLTLTSGTTGQPKYIPVTDVSERGGAQLVRQWLCRSLHDHPRFLSHANVGIVSPAVEGYTAAGLPYGSVSGRIYQRIPSLVRQSYAIPYPVFELQDYDARYWAIARFALVRSVSFCCTPNPSTLMRLAAVMTRQRESLIRAIHDGTLGIPVESTLHQALQIHLRPQPQRARELERIAERTGALWPKDCWPHLSLLGCWIGGSVGVQARQLASAYGNVPLRDLGYMASEARITLPFHDHTPAGVLAIHLNVYEFIPEDCVEDEDPPVLLSHELEQGQRYRIVLTTPGGLYRYDINDIVEVTGLYHRTPMLAFVRKSKDMSNLTGEKLHVNHILMAVEQVKQHLGVAIAHYRAVPSLEEMRYHFYLELSGESQADDVQRYATLGPMLDRALATVNLEYAQKRASQRLQPLCLHLMRPGWGEAEIQWAIANGRRDVQYKWAILSHAPSQPDPSAILKTFESNESNPVSIETVQNFV